MQRFAGILFAIALVAICAAADTHYVSTGGAQIAPYTTPANAARTIQPAVNAAAAGDTVLVYDGNYVLTAQLDIGKGIALKSINGRNAAFIDGNRAVRCFFIHHPAAVVEGFTIRNGRAPGADGGGVYINTGGTVRACNITNNIAGLGGGGVICNKGGLVENCFVWKNRGDDFGGGVLCLGNGGVTDSLIMENGVHGGVGGGLYLDGKYVFARNCRVAGNSARTSGGGVYLNYRAEIKSLSITGNKALYGGGLHMADQSYARKCVISGNNATGSWVYASSSGQGGGVFMEGFPSLHQSMIADNVANDRGGGVAMGQTCNLYSCIVTGNEGLYYGGGIFAGGNGGIYNCTVTGNRALANRGGGIHLLNGGSLWNTIIFGNTAPLNANCFDEAGLAQFSYCCTRPLPPGTGNINVNPQFTTADPGSWALKAGSPCINAGTDYGLSPGLVDYLGRQRVIGSAPDIGAIEYGGVLNDFIGSGCSELTVVAIPGADMKWFMNALSGGIVGWNIAWGYAGCAAVPGDFDGDGVADLTVFHAKTGKWYSRTLSGAAIIMNHAWGFDGCLPVPGDYDGDGRADLGLYSPGDGKWFIKSVAAGILANGLPWGFSGCAPVAGDYDGDGRADLALYNAATGRWYIRTLGGSVLASGKQWGFAGCTPVPGDIDNDGCSDLTVFHAVSGRWYSLGMNGTLLLKGLGWGFDGGIPIVADFNGGGANDLGIYYQAAGRWYIYQPGSGTAITTGFAWGGASMVAVKP